MSCLVSEVRRGLANDVLRKQDKVCAVQFQILIQYIYILNEKYTLFHIYVKHKLLL